MITQLHHPILLSCTIATAQDILQEHASGGSYAEYLSKLQPTSTMALSLPAVSSPRGPVTKPKAIKTITKLLKQMPKVLLRDKDKKEQEEKKALEAFPIPTVQFTNIVLGFDYDHGTVQVFDLVVRKMHKAAVQSRMVPIGLGQYPDGVYIVKVTTNNDEGVVKIMKKTIKN